MSVLSRLRALLGGAPEPEAPAPASAPVARAPVAAPASPAPEETPLDGLVRCAASTDPDPDVDRRAVALFDRCSTGHTEAAALEAARTITHRRRVPVLRTRLADRLFSRGDATSALAVLEPILPAASPDGPVEAWMLAAEIAERHGETARALGLYERVVARDYAHPRARERALRLREARAGSTKVEGATLLGDGVTTRRFRILAEIGRGGAGTVFLAEEPALRRTLALKIYHRRGRTDRDRMLHEARMAASFEHPGVVRVLDLDDSLGAIAMEALEEGSVKARLARGGIPLELALGWARSAADALAFVHSRGVVHGDLKPSNFLLRDEGTVVLTDFGIARALGQAPREIGEGSLGYMPPEQHTGAPASFAMDVHALGISLREMLAATNEGADEGEPPEAFRALVAACASPQPEARPTLDLVRAELG